MQSHDPYQIALRQNIAENGRIFCVALAIINLFVGSPLLAFLSILPLAGAIAVDLMPDGNSKFRASWGVYIFSALVALATFINTW